MELSFWSCTCNDSGSGVLLKQRIPDVALFNGSTLEAWYHNVNGLVTLRPEPSISAFAKQLSSGAILRYHCSGRPQEGLPSGATARLLSLQETTDLLQKLQTEEVPHLAGLWTLQSYVEPRYGIRILSVYTCDAQLEERSDIFSHRFQPAYQAAAMNGPSEGQELEVPYRQAIESKTLGIVRFAHEYHNLDLDGMMLEFIFDLEGQIVLHGCWAMSLCNDRCARRFRAPITPTVWREQRAFEVPKLQGSARSRSELGPKLADKQNFPEGCEFLLEFWQGDSFLGEAPFQCHPNQHSELRVLKLLPHSGRRADGRKLMTESLEGAVAVVSSYWTGGGWLSFKLGRAERLMPPEDAPVEALLWLRQGDSFVPVWSASEVESQEELMDGRWAWVHMWSGETVEVSLRHAARPSSARPIFATTRAEDSPPPPGLQSPNDQVCGAAFAAHWGMSAQGDLQGHRLALQAAQRFKLGRATRSGLLKAMAEKVNSFHNLQRQWEIFLSTMKAKHEEAQAEMREHELRLQETEQKHEEGLHSFDRSLAACCRRLCGEEENFQQREDEDLAELAEVKQRMEEQGKRLVELDQQQAHFQTSLDMVRSKYNDLVAEDVRLRGQLAETREQHMAQQAEQLQRRRLTDDLEDLALLKGHLAQLQGASRKEQKHAARLEDYVRKVANQNAKTLRTGGGYILNSMAKVEAQAFLRELRL